MEEENWGQRVDVDVRLWFESSRDGAGNQGR